jgi:hypothetical protein
MSKPKWKLLLELDDFTTQYLETALWSSTDNADDSGGAPLDDNFGIEDFTKVALKEAIGDCKAFQEYSKLWEADEKSDSSAGHDFWLTRNGHGAGFWDGDYPINGDKLTELSKPYGTVDLMPYRGRIHC